MSCILGQHWFLGRKSKYWKSDAQRQVNVSSLSQFCFCYSLSLTLLVAALGWFSFQVCVMLNIFIFVLRKKGSKTKKRMIWGRNRERRLRAANPKSLFLRFCRTWTKRYLITSQTRVKRVSQIHHRTILRWMVRRMIRWSIRLTRLTLVCEVIRLRLVQVRQNLKKSETFWCHREKLLSKRSLRHILHLKQAQVVKMIKSEKKKTSLWLQ